MHRLLPIALLGLTACGPTVYSGGFEGSANRFDFDGDGLEDLAVGARREAQNTGGVYVFKGTPMPGDRHASSADLVLQGPGPFAFFGDAITGCDLDNDGFGDLIVGGTGLQVFFGAPDFFDRTHPGLRSTSEGLGRALACGDVTGDGVSDLIALDDDGPALHVFAGGPAWSTEALSISALDAAVTLTDDGLWDATLDLGDIDGDGVLDLVVGAHRAADGRGEVRVHRGGALAQPWQVWSGAEGASLGRSVVAVDLDSDGIHDIAAGSLAGEVVVYRGGEASQSPAAVLTTPAMVADDPAWSADLQRPWRHDLAALDADHGGLLQVRAIMASGDQGALFVADLLSEAPRCLGATSETSVQLASSVGALRLGDEVQIVLGAPGGPSSEVGRVLAISPSSLGVASAPACASGDVTRSIDAMVTLSLTGPRSFGETMGR